MCSCTYMLKNIALQKEQNEKCYQQYKVTAALG